jgi:folate-binding protein YgfZ
MPIALLDDRAVLSVSGPDARKFLQGLVTCDVDALGPGQAAFGALLSPQGKILFDFFVVCAGGEEAFLLDTAKDQAPALAKRLGMYRLRAKVVIEPAASVVLAAWDGDSVEGLARFDDPRGALGQRIIAAEGTVGGDAAAYEARRIALGIPRGGADFAWGEAFPHEANMDLVNGVSFTKGCYVGQEVVSRMEHRGTARRRIVTAGLGSAKTAPGAEILAGGTMLGTMGSVADGRGLASIRIDRLAEARASGLTPTAGGAPVDLAAEPARP